MAASMDAAIENYVQGFEDSAAAALANDLAQRRVTLTDLIEKLGDVLTSREHATRARATRLIADVLHDLPGKFLSQQQVGLLSTFLCEKLKDHHSIHAHALYGLVAISQCECLADEMVEEICRTIFREVHTQSLPQSCRRYVFTIFINFLNAHLNAVQKLGTEFVHGYIQAMDAEKDPRNLVLAFSCAYTVIQNLSLGVFVEEMFEVVSCYFPVDFSPSVSDPSGIKKDDLVLSLRRCLAASPKFAEFCLPLLLEKATSDLKSAKIDAFQTLAECCKTYHVESLYEFQSSFFNCIKKEVFLSGDQTVEEAALQALKALVKTLSRGVTQGDKKKSLDGFVEEILTACKGHLLQPELMLMLASGRLLQSAALGSQSACSQILHAVVPVLVETHNKQTQTTPRHNVIYVLNGLVECTALEKYWSKDGNPVITTYKDPLLGVYLQALREADAPSVQVLGIKGLHLLSSLPGTGLTGPERANIATSLVNIAIDVGCDEEVRHSSTSVLRYLLYTLPDETSTDVLPVIFSKLQNEPMEMADDSVVSRPVLLQVLARITCGSVCVQQVVEMLTRLLETTESLELYQAVTQCLAAVAQTCAGDESSLAILNESGVRFIHRLILSHASAAPWRERLTNNNVLTNLAAFLRNVAVNWNAEMSAEFQSLFVNTFLNNQDGQFSPLMAGPDTVYVCLLTPVVCSQPSQHAVPRMSDILVRLHALLQQPLPVVPHTTVCKCLAGVVNKLPAGDHLDALLSGLNQSLQIHLTGTQPELQQQAVRALAWLTKALVLRNHPIASQFTNQVLSYLSDPTLGYEAAQGMRVVVTEYEEVLTRSMRANIRIMYRQRFFQETLPKLIEGHRNAQSETQKNYLLALSFLIQDLGKQVLMPEIPQIYPLLIQSLNCDDLDLQLVTMETLGGLISAAPEVVGKQVDSLIPQVLQLTRYKPSMKVRMAALRCLSELTSLPVPLIVPYQQRIIRSLVAILDDKKRLVRAEAVAARQEWILLGVDKK